MMVRNPRILESDKKCDFLLNNKIIQKLKDFLVVEILSKDKGAGVLDLLKLAIKYIFGMHGS